MRPITRSYEIRNEYTNPLSGKPYYRNSGIIYAVDRSGDKYAVSRVDFERFDEQNFQYIFSPEWSIIDILPTSIFQGIPGLDMSLRLEHYYRVNMTPYFISERTPSESREDLWELLDEVGLDYYDRFEWLLRSNMRSGTDNLIVERAEEPRRIVFESIDLLPTNLQPGDCILIKDLHSVASTSYQLRKYLLQILRSGAQLWDESEDRVINEAESSMLMKILMLQESLDNKRNKDHRNEGIAQAKNEGKYSGRKKRSIDPNLFDQIAVDFDKKKISEDEALRRLAISRSTFYRRLKERKQS
ncbi:MAG: recombinase family protein [Firmicutes bacterium]|nr:recombinase family protein [Bacillota bacterium]